MLAVTELEWKQQMEGSAATLRVQLELRCTVLLFEMRQAEAALEEQKHLQL